MAILGNPKLNRNYRCAPSLLVQYKKSSEDEDYVNVQIDCGKHFRESLCRWYPHYKVDALDAVVLTHDHADALLGLDDLRVVQRWTIQREGGGKPDDECKLPVFVGFRHYPRCRDVFPYLFPELLAEQKPHTLSKENANDTEKDDDASPVRRFVARVVFRTLNDFEVFEPAKGMQVTAVPLWHGRDYLCNGYVFGRTEKVAYLSDVSEIPDSTMSYLKSIEGGIDLLVLDALFYSRPHPTHVSVLQAIEIARELRPKRVLLVGVSDELDHDEANARLSLLNDGTPDAIDIQYAHDGQCVEMCLG